MNLSTALAAIIKNERKAKDLSQQELADRAGLHRTFISRLERGLTEISVQSLCCVALALGTTTSKLLSDSEELQKKTSEQ